MLKKCLATLTVAIISLMSWNAHAWDHPGHMTTASIAYNEIERVRPDLLEAVDRATQEFMGR